MEQSHTRGLLKSVEKSLDVLDLFLKSNRGLSLKEIAGYTTLNISTAFRIVNTLAERQYLQRDLKTRQ